jgi:hypothetical protein
MTAGPVHGAWDVWLRAFDSAKAGSFERLAALAALQPATTDVVWRRATTDLLGDAAPPALLAAAAERLETAASFELVMDSCAMLRAWGRLSVVPLLLRAWERFARAGDALIIPVHISELLEAKAGPLGDPTEFPSVEAYRRAVMDRYEDRKQKFGGDHVYILRGARFGVVRLAEQIIRELREPVFPFFFRRSFEASTGIDCSAFYERHVIQAMAARRMMEAFLDSPATEKFQDGSRYFFGHRIPEGSGADAG